MLLNHKIDYQSYCLAETLIFLVNEVVDEIIKSELKGWQVSYNGFCPQNECIPLLQRPHSSPAMYCQCVYICGFHPFLQSSWANWMRLKIIVWSRCHLHDNENMMPRNKFPDQREPLGFNNSVPSGRKVRRWI